VCSSSSLRDMSGEGATARPSDSRGEYYQLEHGPTVKVCVLDAVRQGLQEKGKTLTEAFAESDANGNKKLEKEEFKAMVLRLVPGLPEVDINQLMKAADRNNDGNIDLEEFCHTFKAGLGGLKVVGDFKAAAVPGRAGAAAKQTSPAEEATKDANTKTLGAANGAELPPAPVNGEVARSGRNSGDAEEEEETAAVLNEIEKSKALKSASASEGDTAKRSAAPQPHDEKGGFLGPLMSCCGLGRDDEGNAPKPAVQKAHRLDAASREGGPPPEVPATKPAAVPAPVEKATVA